MSARCPRRTSTDPVITTEVNVEMVDTVHCLILTLPRDVLAEILSSWIKVEDIAYLDDAICARDTREEWISHVMSLNLVVSSAISWVLNDESSSFAKWCLQRNIRTKKLRLNSKLEPLGWLKFMKHNAANVITFGLCGDSCSESLLLLAAQYFVNLEVVHLVRCVDSFAVVAFLTTMSCTVHTIHLSHCTAALTALREAKGSLSVQHVHIVDSPDADSAVALLASVKHLQTLVLLNVNGITAFLPEITAQHKTLHNFVWESDPEVVEEVCSLALLAPSLTELRVLRMFLHAEQSPSDADIDILIAHCAHLHAIHISNGARLTDAACRTIAARCGDRLTHLGLAGSTAITPAGVQSIATRARSLVDLALAELPWEWPHDSGVSLAEILRDAPPLQYLDLCAMDITAPTVRAMAQTCGSLVYLNLSRITLSIASEELAAVAVAARKLRTLCVTSTIDGGRFSSLSCALWKVLRPGLHVDESGLQESPFWEQWHAAIASEPLRRDSTPLEGMVAVGDDVADGDMAIAEDQTDVEWLPLDTATADGEGTAAGTEEGMDETADLDGAVVTADVAEEQVEVTNSDAMWPPASAAALADGAVLVEELD